jgi:dihydrofolate synthase/folylpolyglutamate synthase
VDKRVDADSAEVLSRLKTLHPKVIDLSLERIARLLAQLGDPQDGLAPVFHVGGTNGKGSVVAFLRAMFEADGKQVHVYTSPHLLRFHERIVLAGREIGEEELASLLLECEAANGGEQITYFEITTAAALLAFARIRADAVLLEVGLGGRFDATNVVSRPAAAIVTPVDLDHQHFLGERIEDIAFEKGGIFKSGAPAVIAAQAPAAREVLYRCAFMRHAMPFIAGEDWRHHVEAGRLIYQDDGGLLDMPLPRLTGRHQFDNAATALAALHATGFGLSKGAMAQGIETAQWPARMQRLSKGPLAQAATGAELWLDGGHNPAAGRALAVTAADLEEKVSAPLHLIVGMLKTKDAGGFFAPFKGLARTVYTVPIPGHDNAFTPGELAHVAGEQGLNGEPADTPLAAINHIMQRTVAQAHTRILICGSLYLAADILRENG